MKGESAPFPPTRWSLILDAKEQDPEAMATLCQQYWQPLYFFARSSGVNPADSEDLTQSFFLDVIEKGIFQKAAPERGRLRNLLLRSFKNFKINEWRKRQTARRGGRMLPAIEIDAAEAEANLPQMVDGLTPELEFERQWAREVLRQAREQLLEVYRANGQLKVYDELKDELEDAQNKRPYREIASELGVTDSAARFIAFKFRQRFRELLEKIVGDTVASREEAQDEIDHLKRLFQT